jgi:hypothetical protein
MARNEASKSVSRRGFLGSAFAGTAVSLLPWALSGETASSAIASFKAKASDADGLIHEEALKTSDRTLIGNVHALLPGAIAFIRNDKAGIVLDIGSDSTGRPGSTAPDFSYSTWNFKVENANLTLRMGTSGLGGRGISHPDRSQRKPADEDSGKSVAAIFPCSQHCGRRPGCLRDHFRWGLHSLELARQSRMSSCSQSGRTMRRSSCRSHRNILPALSRAIQLCPRSIRWTRPSTWPAPAMPGIAHRRTVLGETLLRRNHRQPEQQSAL